jgi:membrane protein implicated in regulation of membrane protease activity
MDPYMVQHWLVWSIVVVLLMLGAWMKMGSYLFYLGLAALLALAEAIRGFRLSIQIVSFVVASIVLVCGSWAITSCVQKRRAALSGERPPPGS